jgi:peptidoglycan/xylan/chitin deacetylase (PgdA/CDA1 family)
VKFTSVRKISEQLKMNVSVIIPAYNVEKTLADTLKSLQAQTFPKWEAIVIDDGSSDNTPVIARQFAAQDWRIRFISQQNSGSSVARNAGVRLAQFDWLLFLDSDDWITPTHLQRMTETLMADASLDAVHCGWVYVNQNGTLSDEMYGDASPDLFPTLARHCAFHICACVVRKVVVEAVGGWDPSLRTCEDWDLWQRIARTGARFGVVKEVLAFYRMQPSSLSRQGNQLFVDAMRVIAQGHSPDPRVPDPHPSHRDGQPPEALPEERLYFASWAAGLILGKGEDARHLLKLIEDVPVPDFRPERVAYCLFESVLLSACQLPTAWSKLWPSVERCIKDFLVALETLSKAPSLADCTGAILERKILVHKEITGPLTLGTTHAVRLEVTEPLPDIHPPTGVERFFGLVMMEGVKLGELELPVIDGLVAGWVLEDAIAAQFARAILGRFFEHTVYAGGEANEDDHDQMGWEVFCQQLWGRPDWAVGCNNDSEARAKLPSAKPVIAGRLMVEISEELDDIHTPHPEVKVGFTAGGVPVGVVTIPVKNNLLKASTLRVALTSAGGYELCRACVREALVGKPLHDSTPLRSRLAQAALARAQTPDLSGNGLVSPQTVVLGARPGRLGTSVSRRALLPRKAAPELVEMARIVGESVQQPPTGKKPDRILYAPELIEHLFSERQSSHSSNPLLPPAPKSWFPKKGLKNSGFLSILRKLRMAYIGNKPKLPIPCTPKLPILMYHRVAPRNLSSTKHYSLTPEAFEKQLRYLRGAGFYSVALDDWLIAMITGRPLPGRAIAFTFDDGYQDFYEYAFPLLKRYGFTATVFLATDFIGGSNQWAEAYEEKVRLMGWEEIRHLKAEGISFGSHSVSHRPLTSLSPAEIVHEGAQSRALIEQGLRVPVTAFAYPYGSFDAVVEHLIGACGYTIGLSSNPGLCHLQGRPLALPRIKCGGSSSFQAFVDELNYIY